MADITYGLTGASTGNAQPEALASKSEDQPLVAQSANTGLTLPISAAVSHVKVSKIAGHRPAVAGLDQIWPVERRIVPDIAIRRPRRGINKLTNSHVPSVIAPEHMLSAELASLN